MALGWLLSMRAQESDGWSWLDDGELRMHQLKEGYLCSPNIHLWLTLWRICEGLWKYLLNENSNVILKNEVIVFQSCSQGDRKCYYTFCGPSHNNNLSAPSFICKVRENYLSASSGQKWGVEWLYEMGRGSIWYVKPKKLCRSFQNYCFFLRRVILIYVLFSLGVI